MPEPLLYLKAMGAAAIVSAMFVLAVAGLWQPAGTALLSSARLNSVCVLGMSLGLAVGYYVSALRLAWPPANGLDRFLWIVVPAALTIELIAEFPRVPRWCAWLLRMSLAATIPRILLHGSVYLSGSGDGWVAWQVGAALAACGGLLAAVWGLLGWLSQRSPGVSIPLALCLSIQCVGLAVMMAGYIKGGAAAFPLAATLVATTVGAKLISNRSGAATSFAAPAILGIGVVGLFGLLFIGHFLGRLSTGSALAMLLAPLLCWATEMPLLRNRKPWLVGSIRLVLVAIPLAVVLTLAKRDFDRDMAPLLSTGSEGQRTGIMSIARSRSLLDNSSPDRIWREAPPARLLGGDAMLSVQAGISREAPRATLTRRELMRVGGLSLFGGMTVPRLLAAAGDGGSGQQGRARSVILFNLLGGPSHQDMFDMKPQAPAEIRGEFQPIATSLPGLQICEHMPNIARLMHKACLIRSVTHNYNAHNPLNIMTGFLGGDPNQLRPLRTDPPDIGAICQYLEMGPSDMPGAFCLPCYPGFGERSQYPGIRRPGPYGGFLGNQYDPLFAVCNPTFDHVPERKYYDPVWPMGEPMLPLDESPVEMTLDRFNERRTLLQQFDDQFRQFDAGDAVSRMNKVKQQAFAMIRSSRTRDAFDLARESDETRERYGRNLHGSSMLVARRLVEAGVPFISVHAENFIPHGYTYDMHENNFGMLKNYNLPVLDKCYPALVEDLESRGLLDSTLIVVMGEMGRSPKVNDKAGRDHWPQCGFCLLTGGGVTPGSVLGASDKHAAYPVSDAVSPSDIVATIYHLLGVDPHMTVDDPAGRPIPISHGGNVIRDIVA